MTSRHSANFRLSRTLVSTIRASALYDATNARLLSTQHMMRAFSHMNDSDKTGAREEGHINSDASRAWSEAIASNSEAIVKADREPDRTIEYLQHITVNTLHKDDQSVDETIVEEERLDSKGPGEGAR